MSKKAPWTSMPQYAKPVTAKKPKRIARRTPRRAKEEREYLIENRIWLQLPENRLCLHCLRLKGKQVRATQVHHSHGKRQRLLLYKPWWRPVCDEGQVWCHANIAEARKIDLWAPVGQWEKQPPKE
jgi:hypothetical protein